MSSSRSRFTIVGLLLVALVVAACTGGSTVVFSSAPGPTAPSADPSASPEASAEPVALKVGLGYIPSVQFAPFYLAQQAGYYEEAGLSVTFENKIDPDLVALVGAGNLDVGISDGTSVIPAVSQAIPIQYIATIYGKFPNVVFAKASSGITKAADLKGRKIGTPGRYGSGWIMLQALLGSAGLTTEDVEVIEYPDFTQRIAVSEGAVDAATGFANNEPVQLELDGDPATILRIDDITPLPGPGLIAGTATLDTKHDAISAFVAATLRAMEAIRADPSVGLEAAIKAVPELEASRDAQAAVLAATIDSWSGAVQAESGLGAIDESGWSDSIAFMTELGLVKDPVTVEDLVRTDLLPGGN